jgi:hypothetical protein
LARLWTKSNISLDWIRAVPFPDEKVDEQKDDAKDDYNRHGERSIQNV